MEFPAKLEYLPKMLSYIKERASALGLTEEKIYKIELASEEALVNIISYAYSEENDKMLLILCSKEKTRFEVLIKDKGIPFNPIDAEVEVDFAKPIDERKIGGLGIYMIRKLVDEVSYQRLENENVFKMVMIL